MYTIMVKFKYNKNMSIYMKRKVVKHGPSTYIISLPSKWVKKYGVTKGSELDVAADEDRLIISSSEQILKVRSVDVDVSNKLRLIEKIIGAIFRSGYDEVKIRYSTNEEHRKIHEVIGSNVIGFEIINEEKNNVFVKSVSRIDPHEFGPMLRRGFLFLISMSEDGLQYLTEKKFDDLLSIALRDNNINKISDFCRRVINKFGSNEYTHNTTLYNIALSVERLGDYLKLIAEHCNKTRVVVSKDTLKLFQKVNEMLREFYECFYDFNLERIQKMMESKSEIAKISEQMICGSNKDETKLVMILKNVSDYISDMTGVLMVNFI